MNVLSMGLPFGQDHRVIRLFRSQRDHEIRILAPAGARGTHEAVDYTFEPHETAADIIQRIARDWPPDMWLCWLPELAPPPRRMEECPVRTAALVSDWSLRYPQLAYNLARFDLVLTDALGERVLRPPGTKPLHLFPLYSHISTVHRNLGLTRDINVLFVGNLNQAIHRERSRLLERLAGLSVSRRVRICGGVFGDDYALLLNRARIVFNHTLRGEMNLRCFEAPACGALVFVEESNLETRIWFADRREAVFYRPENLIELISYYLDHEEERAAIAAAGEARAAELAGEHRLDECLEALSAVPVGVRGYFRLSPEERMLADATQYAFDFQTPAGASAEVELHALAENAPADPVCPALLGYRAFERNKRLGGIEKGRELRSALHWAGTACRRSPESATFLLNLAAVCETCGMPDQAASLLYAVSRASSLTHGFLLYGEMADPQYVQWQKALAYRNERIEMLWAMAATRLARLLINETDWEQAVEWAGRAVSWDPDVPEPYRLRAEAYAGLGRHEDAARDLEVSLGLTAFDFERRIALARTYQALGRLDDLWRLAAESADLFTALPDAGPLAEAFRALVR